MDRRVTFEVTISVPEQATDYSARLILEGALRSSATVLAPVISPAAVDPHP